MTNLTATPIEISRMTAGYYAMNGNNAANFPQQATRDVFMRWLNIVRYAIRTDATREGIVCLCAGLPTSGAGNASVRELANGSMRGSIDAAMAAIRAVQ